MKYENMKYLNNIILPKLSMNPKNHGIKTCISAPSLLSIENEDNKTIEITRESIKPLLHIANIKIIFKLEYFNHAPKIVTNT